MSSQLSIALLSHAAAASAPTGAERSLAQLATGLRRRGHRVAVVVPGRWCLTPELRGHGIEVVEIACRVCWLTYHDPLPWPTTALKWLRFAMPDPGEFRVLRWLARWGPDLVHVNCLPHVRGAAAAASKTVGVPVVWHLREILPPGGRRRWFARRLKRSATRVVAVSEAVARWVRDEGLGGRLDLIHNGVEPRGPEPDRERARDDLRLPRKGFLVGMYGQLVPHKGGPQFIAAAGLAMEEQPALRCVLAGPGSEAHLASLRDAIRDGGHEDRIRLLPPRPAADELLAASDAVCLPTLTPDPFPRSVLEAMAAGLPVVAYRGGGVDEMVVEGETGLLVEPGDVAGLASALARLVADPEASREMGARGLRRAASEFSLDRHIDRMEGLFSRLVEDA